MASYPYEVIVIHMAPRGFRFAIAPDYMWLVSCLCFKHRFRLI